MEKSRNVKKSRIDFLESEIMTEWRPKKADESWEHYSRWQKAYIYALRRELDDYRNLIDSLKNVRYWVDRTMDCYERDVEGKEKERHETS